MPSIGINSILFYENSFIGTKVVSLTDADGHVIP